MATSATPNTILKEKLARTKAELRKLEGRIEEHARKHVREVEHLNDRLNAQAVTLALMAPSGQVTDEILDLLREVADSRSKYAKRARKALGIDPD